MRLVILLWDGGGNVPPVLSLASGLRACGHEVFVAAHENLRSRIQTRDLEFIEYQSGYVFEPTHRGNLEQKQAEAFHGLVFGRAYYQESLRILSEYRPEVVIVDPGLTYALKACLDSDVPVVSVWHSLYSILKMLDSGMSELNRAGHETDYPSFQKLMEASEAVLVFTYRAIDDPGIGVDVANNVYFVGPLREDHAIEEKPSARPFVVVGMSTHFIDQLTVLNNIALALGALNVDGLITTGPSIAPNEIVAPDNVEVRQFVEHDAVLPNADLLITHCGCGTVMAGLKYGNPMLCVPNGGDQPEIATRVERFGLGRHIDESSTPVEFERAIRSLMADKSVRNAARVMAQDLRAHPGMREATQIVEAAATPM